MRLWDDDNGGKWKRSVQDIDGEILCVSQFTLLASTKKGNKPDFHKSAGAEKGKELYSAFFKRIQELYEKDKVKDGVFQALMDVALVNDGPVGVDFTSEHGVVMLLASSVHMSHSQFAAGNDRNRYRSTAVGCAWRIWVGNHYDGPARRWDAEDQQGFCDSCGIAGMKLSPIGSNLAY